MLTKLAQSTNTHQRQQQQQPQAAALTDVAKQICENCWRCVCAMPATVVYQASKHQIP
jgi:hypothetical protein